MGVVMLSRLADSLYWMSRYVERAENVARFIDVNTWLSLDLPEGYQEQWSPLISTTGDEALFSKYYENASKRNVIQFLTFDTRNPNSILSAVSAARENARIARQYITLEMWEQINRFYFTIHTGARAAARGLEPSLDFFTEVVADCHLFLGILVRDHVSQRRLALLPPRPPARACRQDVSNPRYEVLPLVALGRLPSALRTMTSCGARFCVRPARSKCIESDFNRFRLTASSNFSFWIVSFRAPFIDCLVSAESSLHTISGTPMGSFGNTAEQHLGRLCGELNYIQVREIINRGLHEFLDDIQVRLNLIGDAIHLSFFALQPLPVVPQYSAGRDA